MSEQIKIGGRLHSIAEGNVTTGANEILDDSKGKKQDVINQETDAELERLNNAKQDNLTFDTTPTEGSTNPITSGGVYAADEALQQAIEAILLLIPSAASALNQLADKAFVNSTVATNTATFRGTYNVVSDLELHYDATHQQIATALLSKIQTADNNDYCFVQIPISDSSGDIRVTERYKFNGTAWSYEYDLNNSGFTAVQWAAINSTITQALVEKLGALPTAAELAIALNGKQNTLTFDTAPVAGSSNPVTSAGLYSAFAAINATIPDGASADNKLVAETRLAEYVAAIINALDATYNVTSTDGHVNVRLTQVDGAITSVEVLTNDIASAAALNTLTGRVSTAESDIDALQDAYAALTQSDVVIVNGALPSSGQQQNIIYRQPDQDHTPPQFYSDYMWNGTTWVLMATYNNAIDPRPKKGSQNLVTSGGVFDNMGALDVSELNATEKPHTLATYADLSAALAAIPSDYQKGGMQVKFIQGSVGSSDNNYVQFRYMSSSTTAADFTNVANWQGVDDEPTAGSDNLVESGGVYDAYSRVFGRSVTFNSNLATSGFTIIAAPADYQKWDLRNKVVLKVTSLSVDSLDDIDWSYFDANGNTVQKHSSDVIDSIEEGTEITLFDEEGAIMRAITFNPSASPIQSPVTISLEVSETESLKHDVELNTEGINALNGDIRNIKGAELKINKTLAPTGSTIILNTTDQGSLYLKDCVKLKVNALGTDHIDSLYYSYVNSQGTVLTRETISLGRFLSSGDVITLFNTEGCKLRTVVFKASDNHITENTDISISLFEDSIKADTVLNRDDIDNCNKELYGTQFMSLLATSGFTIIMNPSDADTYNIKDIAYLTVDSLFNSDSLAQLDYSYFDKNNNVVQKYLYNIQSGKTYKLFEEGGAKLRAITFNPAVSPILLQTEIRLSVNSKNIAGEVENLKNEVRLIPSFVPEQVLCIKGQNLIIYQNNMFGINDNDTTVSVFVNKPRTNRLGTIFENIQANESVKVTARYNNTDHDYNISLVCKEISQPQGNWFILPIGDSILYSANLSHRGVFNNELSRRFSGVGVPSDSPDFPVLPPSKGWTNIKVIGTMIDDNLAPYPVKYEGRGGWSPYMYMNTQEGNAFYNPNVGHFDLDYYLTENGFYAEGVESDGSNLIIPIMLNWNDYKNNLDTFIQRYKALLDNITTSHPAAKVLVLGMNAPSQPIYRTVIFPDGMSSNQEDVKARLIDIENRLEDMVASYVNVYHVPLLPFFTAEDSYPKTTVVYNPRTTNTTELYTDLVHPNYIGNGQMVDIVFNYICCKFFSA